MALEYDEKGKIFTDVITKEGVLTRIQTLTHLVKGKVHVRRGERLSDEINSSSQFLPVTDAEVYSADGTLLLSTAFIAINRQQIVWLMPLDEAHTTGGAAE